MYSSSVEYGGDTVAQYMRNIAQTHLAGFGTRILYTTAPYNSFDNPRRRVGRTTRGCGRKRPHAVADFYDDLKEHKRRRRRDSAGLHRVRAARPRQRFGNRPRFRRRGLRGRRPGEGAACTANTRRWKRTSCWRATCTSTTTSAASTPPCWRSGWGLDAQPIVNGSFEQMGLHLARRREESWLQPPEYPTYNSSTATPSGAASSSGRGFTYPIPHGPGRGRPDVRAVPLVGVPAGGHAHHGLHR